MHTVCCVNSSLLGCWARCSFILLGFFDCKVLLTFCSIYGCMHGFLCALGCHVCYVDGGTLGVQLVDLSLPLDALRVFSIFNLSCIALCCLGLGCCCRSL